MSYLKSIFFVALLCFSVNIEAQHLISWDEAYQLADKKIADLSLDQKIHFIRGYSEFFFYGVPDKGIPYLYHSDATQGVNIRRNLPDTTMVKQLDKSTAFPCPLMLAATFNTQLAKSYAKSVGEECRAGGIEVLLGPGVNITKNSQCGRNFEYFGEDPFLSASMAATYVQAIQSTGTAACLKHFICNETEFYRRRSNSIVDERALHEIYMPPFKAGINAGAAYIMASYNQVNGEWTGQNSYLLKDLLRNELGFKGCIISDWSSVYDTKKVIKNGLNTEMPGRKDLFNEVSDLLKKGVISEKDIDTMIRPAIATGYAMGFYDRYKYVPELLKNFPQHENVAYNVASQGVVLLRNNGILPISQGKKILLTGKFLNEVPRTGDNPAASAAVKGYNNITLAQAMQKEYGDLVNIVERPTKEQLSNADIVLVSAGTIDMESFERPFALDKDEEAFIKMAVDANPNTIVLVNSGSGLRMTGWNDKTAAIIYGWYPGQNGTKAIVDIISGKVNPSGKLPLTIEREFSDSPANGIMPKGAEFYNKAYRAYNEKLISVYDVKYDESVLVGYRWYEAKNIKPLYPFGYGLSYTTFSLAKPHIEQDKESIKIRVKLNNTGTRDGAEVVQVYATQSNPSVIRPPKELKAFNKIEVKAGKSSVVEFELNKNELAFWDVNTHSWKFEPGKYIFSIGNSSDNISHKLPLIIK